MDSLENFQYNDFVHYIIFPVEDLEMHDGSPEKPYFMSKNLMKILNKTNKFEEPKGKK